MPFRERVHVLSILMACAFVSLSPAHADPGDVDSSQDYPGWSRMPGYIITDYDEDNPSEFVFPVTHPLALDASHQEAVMVKGHRYVIHYEWGGSGRPPTLLQAQSYYEKLAGFTGYVVEKNGLVGDVSETFHLTKGGTQVWIYLEPSVKANVITIVESRPPIVPKTTTAAAPPPPAQSPPPSSPATGQLPDLTPASAFPLADDDPLAKILLKTGRVVLPVTFQKGKSEVDPDSQPLIDRVIAIMKAHPELSLTVEGHTDLSGDPDQNRVLSEDRARAVRSLIIAGHIGHKRLVAVGLGGTQPIADESTPEGREKDRRIELVVRKSSGNASQKSSPSQNGGGGDADPFHQPAPDGVNYYPVKKNETPTPP
jgi:outer membrane protein OmpA-like peptidoglycan-associated protein